MKANLANVKSPRISSDGYLPGVELSIAANLAKLAKSGFLELPHVEQQTDDIWNKIRPEQVQIEVETSQLLPVHEDAASATENTALCNTLSLIPGNEDGLKTDNTEATPTPDPEPLENSSPFANMFKLKSRKAKMGLEGEKGSENDASEGLIDFLIKSGLF